MTEKVGLGTPPPPRPITVDLALCLLTWARPEQSQGTGDGASWTGGCVLQTCKGLDSGWHLCWAVAAQKGNRPWTTGWMFVWSAALWKFSGKCMCSGATENTQKALRVKMTKHRVFRREALGVVTTPVVFPPSSPKTLTLGPQGKETVVSQAGGFVSISQAASLVSSCKLASPGCSCNTW